MPQINFRGARVRYIDLRRDDEAGVFARIHLTADYSDPVQQEMGWEGIPKTVTSCKLIGRLSAMNLVLTPTDPQLSRNEVQCEASEACDFQLFPTKNDAGDVTGHELRFIVRTIEVGAVALLESYIRVIGGGTAFLKIAYAEQSVLDTKTGDSQMTLEAMPDAVVPELDEPEPEPQDDAPLPSVTQMAGTTAELRKQRRGARRGPIPQDPGAPEWRTDEEIAEGTPHHISTEVM